MRTTEHTSNANGRLPSARKHFLKLVGDTSAPPMEPMSRAFGLLNYSLLLDSCLTNSNIRIEYRQTGLSRRASAHASPESAQHT
jgi:hypothetical protein